VIVTETAPETRPATTPETGPADDPEHREPPMTPRRPRRWLVLLAPGGAALAYLLLLAFVPAFRAYTLDGLAALDLYRFPSHDPGRQALIEVNGRTYLWGGAAPNDHFDVTASRLDLRGVHYGMGRDHFDALIEPSLAPLDEVREWPQREISYRDDDGLPPTDTAPWLHESARVLVVSIDGDTRVYPILLLQRHELINDVVGGVPVFAAFCPLADLGAVYDRRYDAHVLTFGVSGYTYAERGVWDGKDAFLLWDRETESLWWPPSGRAVSGPLMDTPLRLLDEAHWEQTTWGAALARYGDVLVLRPGQTLDPPETWPRLDLSDEAIGELGGPTRIAPIWPTTRTGSPAPRPPAPPARSGLSAS
jgi:hypothetical protein